jgi:Family of unknown function (DUF6494)
MNTPSLDEEKFNLEIRKFLKKVGISSQREIERAVREGLENGQLKGGELLNAQMTLDIAGLELHYTIDGEIALS